MPYTLKKSGLMAIRQQEKDLQLEGVENDKCNQYVIL